MKHEERKRELALKTTPGPWTYDAVKAEILTEGNTWWSATNDFEADRSGPLIAFHDPQTALLEAAVLAAARALDAAYRVDNTHLQAVRSALDALDAHAAEKEKT